MFFSQDILKDAREVNGNTIELNPFARYERHILYIINLSKDSVQHEICL